MSLFFSFSGVEWFDSIFFFRSLLQLFVASGRYLIAIIRFLLNLQLVHQSWARVKQKWWSMPGSRLSLWSNKSVEIRCWKNWGKWLKTFMLPKHRQNGQTNCRTNIKYPEIVCDSVTLADINVSFYIYLFDQK